MLPYELQILRRKFSCHSKICWKENVAKEKFNQRLNTLFGEGNFEFAANLQAENRRTVTFCNFTITYKSIKKFK